MGWPHLIHIHTFWKTFSLIKQSFYWGMPKRCRPHFLRSCCPSFAAHVSWENEISSLRYLIFLCSFLISSVTDDLDWYSKTLISLSLAPSFPYHSVVWLEKWSDHLFFSFFLKGHYHYHRVLCLFCWSSSDLIPFHLDLQEMAHPY